MTDYQDGNKPGGGSVYHGNYKGLGAILLFTFLTLVVI